MKKYPVYIFLFIPFLIFAQSSWKRTSEIVQPPEELFHSSQTANLPTTEILGKGNFLFEISHRFGKTSGGYENLYGLDGPVTMRLALSYGLHDDLMITVGRSNVQDNLDFRIKYKLSDFSLFNLPAALSGVAGIAFNTETFSDVTKRDAFNPNNTQYYFQAVINTMLPDKKLGIGIVPSFVYNSFIFADAYNKSKRSTFAVPFYAQYYFNRMWSLWVEVNPVISGWKGNIFSDADPANRSHNTLALGLTIETGGHLFHLFITNSDRLNPTQFLVGAGDAVNNNSLRLAFGITRQL